MTKQIQEGNVLRFTNELTLLGIQKGFLAAKKRLGEFREIFPETNTNSRSSVDLTKCEIYNAFLITGFAGASSVDTIRRLEDYVSAGLFSSEEIIKVSKLAIAFERDRNILGIATIKNNILEILVGSDVFVGDEKEILSKLNEVSGI